MMVGMTPLLTRGPWALYLGEPGGQGLSIEEPWRGVHWLIMASSVFEVVILLAKKVVKKVKDRDKGEVPYLVSMGSTLVDNNFNIYQCGFSHLG